MISSSHIWAKVQILACAFTEKRVPDPEMNSPKLMEMPGTRVPTCTFNYKYGSVALMCVQKNEDTAYSSVVLCWDASLCARWRRLNENEMSFSPL